ncbi:uncharacterized protein METZ01_LOCUS348207, partial [marine metagenome]
VTLLGVELHAQYVVPGDSRDERCSVNRRTDDVPFVSRNRGVRVDEVVTGVAVQSIENWVRSTCLHAGPSHVWNRDRPVGRYLGETSDYTGDEAKTFGGPFLTGIKQQLHAEADPEDGGSSGHCLSEGFIKSPLDECRHA